MDELDYMDWASLLFVTLGAVNLGLIGLGQLSGSGADAYNLVNILLGGVMAGQVESALYIVIGLAGLYQVYFGYQLYQK